MTTSTERTPTRSTSVAWGHLLESPSSSWPVLSVRRRAAPGRRRGPPRGTVASADCRRQAPRSRGPSRVPARVAAQRVPRRGPRRLPCALSTRDENRTRTADELPALEGEFDQPRDELGVG